MLHRKNEKRTGRTAGRHLLTNGLRAGFLRLVGALAGMALLSVFFLSLYHAALTSPLLRLEEVVIEGVDPVLETELMALTGLHSGLSLAGIRLESLRQKLEKHPWVCRAELQRRLPNTLLIRIEKQQPVAIVVLEQNYFLNRHGEFFKKVTVVDAADLPVISGLNPDSASLRQEIARGLQVLEAIAAAAEPWSLNNLAEVHLKEGHSLALFFTHSKAEVQATDGELAEKLPLLQRVAAHLEKKGELRYVKTFNLNYSSGAVAAFGNS